MHTKPFSALTYVFMSLLLLAVMMLCICIGSVSTPLADTWTVLWNTLFGLELPQGVSKNIILNVRLPRVLNVALVGAALSLCGAAMQGLLRNPLADGSTLGVSSGASLGAVLAILLDFSAPGSAVGSVTLVSMLFAFLSLLLILSFAYALDHSLSTNSLILIGVIFTMFVSSIMTLLVTFAGDKLRTITFWTLGSLSGAKYSQAGVLFLSLLLFGGVILFHSRELNAFAIGEENARHIGVPVKRIKLLLLISVSALIGVCVSVSGTISFVGLVIPHMMRMLLGPNYRRLLPVSLIGGSIFLLLADLVARTLLSPRELPIGVVTSLVGAVSFVLIFYRTRKGR